MHRTTATTPSPTAPRTAAERMTVAGRVLAVLVVLGGVFGLLWVALPLARAAMMPDAPPGTWVLGPAYALRFAACTVIAALTVPFAIRPIGRRWREHDLASRGAAIDPLASRPETKTKTLIKGAILFVVYAIGGAFYFASYTEVLEDRVVIHSPLGARSYGWEHVLALELHAPRGGQPERYAMHFDDDRWGYFDTDCEGTSEAEIAAVAAHVSSRTGLRWVSTDAR